MSSKKGAERAVTKVLIISVVSLGLALALFFIFRSILRRMLT
jgi:hypothetical protein